jgi:hypothetical protein
MQMKRHKIRSLLVCLALFSCFACLIAQIHYQPVNPQMLLPDGTPFQSWSDQTQYTRTYYVSQDPRASDANDGTEEHPFRTVNHAAQIVKPGERVWIHAGVYRELVRPRFSGESPDRMIAYEAAPGERVVLSGSRVVPTRWELSVDPSTPVPPPAAIPGNRNQNDDLGFRVDLYSRQLWMMKLPDGIFDDGYFPFQMPNFSNEEFDQSIWPGRWKGRIPYSLPRGMLFQDGRRMAQLATYEDLVRLPGSYWVAPDGKTVHIHPFDGANPNSRLFEAAVQGHIIQPQTAGLAYIRVSRLILEDCANGFGDGALSTMGNDHWIIEDNTIQHVNSVGIEMGYYPHKGQGGPPDPDPGHLIVRRNRIYDCGTAGMHGPAGPHGLVEENEVVHCGWQDVEYHWEVAAIKLFGNDGTLVRNNHIADMQGGDAIWLDWDNQNSRVTGNVIQDVSTMQGAIWVEASGQQKANMVDNNFMWNINGEGVRIADTDNTIVAHNFFANVIEELVMAKVATDRTLHGRKLTSTGNQFVNNIVVDQGKPILFEDKSNIADYNVYVSTQIGKTAWKDSGPHSLAIHATVGFDEKQLLLSWASDSSLPVVPVVKNCVADIFRRQRTADQNLPGPFLGLAGSVTLQLHDAIKVPWGTPSD